MANAENTAAVAEIVENLRSANAAMLTEYRGLDVKQLKELRRSLGDNASYAVVKNTLTKIAAREVGIEGLDTDLQGPTAIAYVTGEPVEVAKALRDFAKANPALVIKSGVLDGSPLTAADINKLADLDSREVLLAKAAGAMKGKLNQTAYLLVALPSQAVRVIEALRQKVESEGPATPADEPVEGPKAAAPAESDTSATDAADKVADDTSATDAADKVADDTPATDVKTESSAPPAAAESSAPPTAAAADPEA